MLRGLAAATPQRMAGVPDIPTSAEIGVPNWIVSTWYGLWAIKGTPQPIVERMYHEVAKALQHVEKMQAIWKDKAARGGRREAGPSSPKRIRAEIEKWQKVVRRGGCEDRLSSLQETLRRTIKGEVLFDAASRGRYSTDASIYQIEPVGRRRAARRDRSRPGRSTWRATPRPRILPRGAGTSQCGQTVGAGAGRRRLQAPARGRRASTSDRAEVTVQPGVVLDQLNAWLQAARPLVSGRRLDLGAMHPGRHGGQQFLRQPLDPLRQHGAQRRRRSTPSWPTARARASTRQAAEDMQPAVRAIADKVAALGRSPSSDEIERMYPKVLRRVGGYNLDIFFPQSERPYTTDNSVNLAHLLVGSEGTLGGHRSG